MSFQLFTIGWHKHLKVVTFFTVLWEGKFYSLLEIVKYSSLEKEILVEEKSYWQVSALFFVHWIQD